MGTMLMQNKTNSLVKAETVDDEGKVDGEQTPTKNNEFVVMGRIIPVDEQDQEIKDAPVPHYRRDPDNPAKAIPTPAPKVNDYQVGKNDNYHPKTNLVDPPADPTKDTRLIYKKKDSKEIDQDDQQGIKIQKPSGNQNQRAIEQDKSVASQKNQSTLTTTSAQATNSQAVNKNQAQQQDIETAPVGSTQKSDDSEINRAISTQNFANQTPKSFTDNDQNTNIVKKKKIKPRVDNKHKKQNKIDQNQRRSNDKKRNSKKNPLKLKHDFQQPKVILNKETKLPKKLFATIKIVDQQKENKVLEELTTSGEPGQRVVFSNLKEVIDIYRYDGYQAGRIKSQLTGNVIIPTDFNNLDLGIFNDQNLEFIFYMDHSLEQADAAHLHELPKKLFSIDSKLIVHFRGAGIKTPEEFSQKITWTRKLTYDLVDKTLVKGKYDTEFMPDHDQYQAVKAPKIAGYQAKPEEIPALAAQMQTIEKTITYMPIKSKIDTKLPDKARAESKLEGKLFLVDVDHPQSNIPKEQYERQFAFIVEFSGAGKQTPAEKVQTIKQTRQLTVNAQGKIVFGKYTTNWKFVHDRYNDVEVPQISGYETDVNQVKGPKAQERDQTVKVVYRPISEKNELATFTEVIHFVDDNEQELAPAQELKLSFSKDSIGWNAKIATFKTIMVPVVTGYFAESKQVQGKSIMPTDSNKKLEIMVHYHKLGQIIPIDADGKIVEHDAKKHTFENDPHDASLAQANQAVPEIPGWQSQRQTVSPLDPAIDIPVIYQKIEAEK